MCCSDLGYDFTVRFVDSPEPPNKEEVIAQYEKEHPDFQVRTYRWKLVEDSGRYALAELFGCVFLEKRVPLTEEEKAALPDFIDVEERS